MNRTYDRLKLFTSWPGTKQELEEYVRQCETCQKNMITQNKTRMPMKITTTPEVVWEKCALDIVGPLSQTLDGNKYVLTFQDELSKYTLAKPAAQQDAMTISKAFVEVILKFGIPQMILTDQGSSFLSEIFTNVCKVLKIKKIKCTAYHPQSNGALERTHHVLVEYLDVSFWKTRVIGTNGCHMPPSCLTPHLILPRDLPPMNYYLVGNRIYLAYYRRNPLIPSTHMTIMLRNYSLDYSPAIRWLHPT